MRTTITIEDALLRAAKVLAAQQDRTVSSILEQALQELLDRAQQEEVRRRAAFDLPVFDGGFTMDPNDNRAVRDALEGA